MATDPTGPASGSGRVRVQRGGSWAEYASRCQSAYRGMGNWTGDRQNYLGFRLLRKAQ